MKKYRENQLKQQNTYGGIEVQKYGLKLLVFLNYRLESKSKKHSIQKKNGKCSPIIRKDLTKSELKALYATGVRCRGHHKAGNEEFFKQTGKKLYVNQYRKLVVNPYVNPKKVKCRQSGQERFHNRIGYVSIHILLRAVEINKYLDDYLVQELKRSAEKFQQLLLIHAEHHEDERIARFSHYHKVINRREFKKIQFFLDYVNELKQISINLYSDQVGRHPLLFPQIDQNKQSKIYELLIWGNDWQSNVQPNQIGKNIQCQSKKQKKMMITNRPKINHNNPNNNPLQIINPDSLEPETSKLKLNSYDLVSTATHKVCNNASKQQIKQLDKQELKSFRGHYYRDGQIRTKGLTTILFDTDMRSDEDDQDQCQNIEENRKEFFDKMEEIYDCVFGGKASLVSFEKSLQFPN
ncbi:unnamed protein product (macronuclear) [Paramecium tetraurelia]|uniref:Uncharacterized protein n=1 Tax=Paramecium tetraurelia TaxID=5888 RepID=A0DFV2_PARTE|nr:uncharacterized protein GSPATT00039481001 [Paramecium tetraurelia]CAK81919.1 unnamed protein product [Paramecium tetraurelia]|eukprot:XP_001449316.1 hypothetical protein (macronuclear) [Paramecium tetraurelia strain d4-2]